MARKRAVILELDGRVARVLASGGEFRTIRAPRGLSVGDEIDLDAVMPAYNWRPQLALVATLVIMLVFSSAGLNTLATSFNRVEAYVTVDINPSVELGVNRWGWVISARGLNSEGIDLLGATEYRAFKLADYVPELTRLATERGYIAEGKANTVIVAAAPAGNQAPPETIAHEVTLAKEQTAAAVSSATSVPVTVTTIVTPDSTLRDDAEAMNLSLGKLAVVLEARDSGVPVRVSDVERDGLAKAIEAAGGKYHDLVVKAQGEGDFGTLATQFKDQLKREKDDDDRKGQGHDKGNGDQAGHDGAVEPGQGAGPNAGTSDPGTGGGSSSGSTGNGTQTGGGQTGTPAGGGSGSGGHDNGNNQGDSGHDSGNSQGNGGHDNGSNQGNSGQGSGKNQGSDKGQGPDDKGKGNGNGNGKNNGGNDADKFAERIRDGFRELGERIKHGMGKDR